MAPSWVLHIFTLILSIILFTSPCGMNRVPDQNSAKFWHKFCRLFCPFPIGCNAEVYLSLQQIQMLLERKGLLATLQSFPKLLQDSDKLQHTALVTLEEKQRSQVLMRFKDFFHPKETLPEAAVKPTDNAKVATSVTLPPDIHMEQHVEEAKMGLEKEMSTLSPDGDLYTVKEITNHVAEIKHESLKRTAPTESLGNTFTPYVNTASNKDPNLEQISMQTVPPKNQNETDLLSESIEKYFDVLKFQQILSALPDAILFSTLCRKCAANVRKHPNRHGRKLLRLILQNNQEANGIEISEQEFERFEFRTQLELFNSIGRPGKPASDTSITDNYMQNAIDYTTPLSGITSDIRDIASRKSQSILELKGNKNNIITGLPQNANFQLIDDQFHKRGKNNFVPGFPQNANFQSIADQFHKAEVSRQQSNGGMTWKQRNRRDLSDTGRRRRRKRTVLKTQVCPVVQSWSNLVLAKTANGTLVQIAQFPEVNLEQWFLEEKCKYPISPILDDVTCEVKDRLVDAVIIPVSNPTLPIQTMKIKIQCCVSMYNLDDGRN